MRFDGENAATTLSEFGSRLDSWPTKRRVLPKTYHIFMNNLHGQPEACADAYGTRSNSATAYNTLHVAE